MSTCRHLSTNVRFVYESIANTRLRASIWDTSRHGMSPASMLCCHALALSGRWLPIHILIGIKVSYGYYLSEKYAICDGHCDTEHERIP